jgi:hypothetical protein
LAIQAGPTIGSVVVVENAAPKNGILESNEALKITWAASSVNGAVSQTVTVDGSPIATINGPYSGLYYSCPIGMWAVGNHTYTIRSTDSKGVSLSSTGTFAVVAPIAPVIANVAVAESAAPKNGILESNEALKITWSASSVNGVASQSMTVDGRAVATINGPYSGLYYSCPIGVWGVGTHNYTIRTIDSKRVTADLSGSFTVVSPVPPAISAVVVAEAGAPKNGILESNEKLKITWAASSQHGIASQTMTVDGRAIAPINGPYSGLYYSCPIGMWSAGSHTYTIHSTDSKGVSSNKTGTFTVATPLMVDASAAPQGATDMLADGQLAPIVAEAIHRLESQLGSQVETAMAGVDIEVANLSPAMLGEKLGKTIWIDDDAAGYGWFVDPTPQDDSEFMATSANSLTARTGTAAAQRADLLTVVMHEMGHVLGYADTSLDDLMGAMLPLGTRRPLADPV